MRLGDVLESDATPESAYLAGERVKVLCAAIRGLSQRQRASIVLHYWAEMPLAEIGAAMGVTESAVSHLHRRALRALAEALAGKL